MQPGRQLLQAAIAKARTAYGESIDNDLARAVERLFERPGRLERCMEALQIALPAAQLRQRIKQLAARR
ncbi:MAG TPA: hypothetical protein VGI11_18625 [Variovorax sp.]